MEAVHPFYESHRGAMEAAMHERAAIAAAMLCARADLPGPTPDPDRVRDEMMAEFATVLAQTPYVGGAANRMSEFFMRLIGFMAIGRVLKRHGIALPAIVDIQRETYAAQLMAAPEAERLESGRQFLSAENRAALRAQAKRSLAQEHEGDFVYDFVEPGPGDDFEFGIDYTACGFCKFAAKHGDRDILPAICGLDFAAYAARGIRLERSQTLAGGASHCNFRFSAMAPKA